MTTTPSFQPFSHVKSPVMNNYQNSPSTGSTSSPFLPGYLLGGNSPAQGNVGYGRKIPSSSSNLTGNSARLIGRSPMPNSSPNNNMMTSPLNNKVARFSHGDSDKLLRKDKPGAPPTESLYTSKSSMSEINETVYDHQHSGRTRSHEEYLSSFQPRDNVFHPEKQAEKIRSPAQIDPFYSQGDTITSDDVLDETAITVFGFAPSACSFILQQFSQHGNVEKYEVHNHGNWMHIKYQTKLQAKKALSKNGKIFARTMMIGVCPCIKKEISNMENSLMNTTTTNECDKTPVIGSKRTSSSIRSLASTNTPNRNPITNTMYSDKGGTPQKKDSVVSKALDYVFGW